MVNTLNVDDQKIFDYYNYLLQSGLAEKLQTEAKQRVARYEKKNASKNWLDKYKEWKNNYVAIHGEHPNFKTFIRMLSYHINN